MKVGIVGIVIIIIAVVAGMNLYWHSKTDPCGARNPHRNAATCDYPDPSE